MKFKKTPSLCLAILMIFLSFISSGCSRGGENRTYLTQRSELMKAVTDGKSEIYAGDIEFDENDLYVLIDRSVKIIGKPEGSTFSKGVFLISAPETENNRISVYFENIIFDGCYAVPEGDPGSYASFVQMHGERTGKNCFTFSGQLYASFENCVFRRYCSKYASVMNVSYSNNGADVNTHVDLTLNGCTFEQNVAEKGILWLNGKKGSESDISITDTVFKDNRAYTGVVTLGNVKGKLERVTVRNNIRTVYAEKNTFKHAGGGLHIAKSELLLKDCVIDGNSAPNGGGISVAAASVVLDGCRIINNTADCRGGGMLIESGENCPVYVTNCLISGNRAEEEGAVYVWPADQINIGLPTGITEFSFCTFENNVSSDKERFVFHPVATESPETTVGRDGKIDFYACRITDDKVTNKLVSGENANVINSKEIGDAVPPDIVSAAANGRYAGSKQTFYPGVNKIQPAKDPKTAMTVAACIIVASCIVFTATVMFSRKKSGDETKETEEKPAEPQEQYAEQTEAALLKIAADKKLTSREIDVLREYVSGKTRTEIAEALFISGSTVKNHISNIFAKLGVRNKEDIMALISSSK